MDLRTLKEFDCNFHASILRVGSKCQFILRRITLISCGAAQDGRDVRQILAILRAEGINSSDALQNEAFIVAYFVVSIGKKRT